MGALSQLAAAHDLAIVEDAAHALESTVDGRHCGTLGSFGCFSFYVTKSLTTVEGGMVVARDRRAADRVKTLALHGMSADAWRRYSDEGFIHYDVVEPGFKYNLTDLAASIGLHQLTGVEDRWARRQEIWRIYDRELHDLPLHLPAPPAPGTRHALHLYTCLVDDQRTQVTRDQVLGRLHALRIGGGVHYRPVHQHPWYSRTYGARTGSLPHAEWVGARTLSLPLSAGMSDGDAADVVRALRLTFSA
jgi:dTDP-4-amino-4,6-dideoxygalactose transaminase